MFSARIFRKDAKGQIRFWQYEVDGARWRSHSGVEHTDTITTTAWTVCTPKSKDTAEQQAEFEAQAEFDKKLARLYRRTVEELDGDMMFAPMLAKTWVYDEGRIKVGVYLQPKLDGIRCVATAEGLFTRQGKPITGLPHIEEALAPWFADWPEATLDGELYSHDYREDFEKIVSAVRKQKGVSPDASKIEYHIYDLYDPNNPHTPFSQRSQWVDLDFGDGEFEGCVSVNTLHTDSPDGFKEITEAHLAMGYEGSMVRLDTPYEIGRRSKNLLKVKEFMDTEFTLTDILEGEGNWAGYGKKIVFQLPDGRPCGGGVKGDQAFTKHLIENKARFVGAAVTIQHFGHTSDGMPRFPVAIKFWPEGKI